MAPKNPKCAHIWLHNLAKEIGPLIPRKLQRLISNADHTTEKRTFYTDARNCENRVMDHVSCRAVWIAH